VKTIVDQIEDLMAEFGDKSLPMIGEAIALWRHATPASTAEPIAWLIETFADDGKERLNSRFVTDPSEAAQFSKPYHRITPLTAALSAVLSQEKAEKPVAWRSISEADKTIVDVLEFPSVSITLRNSARIQARDIDGRTYEAAWTDHKGGYWWDFESESPADPVDFKPIKQEWQTHPDQTSPMTVGPEEFLEEPWVMVPVKPTYDMWQRGCASIGISGTAAEIVYGAMLAARPSPSMEVERLREALNRMEWACEQLAATRPISVYGAMIEAGQADALLELDNARRSARDALASLPQSMEDADG
jgi:hypothetical protein